MKRLELTVPTSLLNDLEILSDRFFRHNRSVQVLQSFSVRSQTNALIVRVHRKGPFKDEATVRREARAIKLETDCRLGRHHARGGIEAPPSRGAENLCRGVGLEPLTAVREPRSSRSRSFGSSSLGERVPLCPEYQVREGIVQRNVPSSIFLSGLRPIPPRGQGVPAQALLLYGQPNLSPSVGDGISRASDPQRSHPGGNRRRDAFRAHDGDEVARAHGNVRARP